MRVPGSPAFRRISAGLLAAMVVVLLDFSPLHLVAYGQTAGPLPPAPQPPAFLPPPAAAAVAATVPSNCTVLNADVSVAAGGSIAVRCSGGGEMAITVPPGAVDGAGTLSLVTVGDALSATADCTGANQLSILAFQHFLLAWKAPGQPPRTDLSRPAAITLPVAPAILAEAGGDPARVVILQRLGDGSVTSLPATVSADGLSAAFQSIALGDFFAVALPPGLPLAYAGTAGEADALHHQFVLSDQPGRVMVQSDDRQGGTAILHGDGSPARFEEIPTAQAVRVDALPRSANCGGTNNVVAVRITLAGPGPAGEPPPFIAPLPRHMPATGLGGAD
jgi:hypothetical protein